MSQKCKKRIAFVWTTPGAGFEGLLLEVTVAMFFLRAMLMIVKS